MPDMFGVYEQQRSCYCTNSAKTACLTLCQERCRSSMLTRPTLVMRHLAKMKASPKVTAWERTAPVVGMITVNSNMAHVASLGGLFLSVVI